MLPKRCILLLLPALLQTSLIYSGAKAQTSAGRGLGYIIQPPVDVSAPLGSNATFRCEAIGNVFWSLGAGVGTQIQTPELVAGIAEQLQIFFPLSTPSSSEVVITATLTNNGTVFVRCQVEESFGSLDVLNVSDAAGILVYGEPSPPTTLTLQLPAEGLGVMLSWQPGFAHRGEVVTFLISSEEIATGSRTELNTSLTSITLTPSSQSSTCQQFNFTVHSENLFSQSATGISEVALIPTIPRLINTAGIQINLLLNPSASLSISVPDLSPCDEFRVQNVVLIFSEIANAFGTEQSPPFNVSSVDTVGNTLFTVTPENGLLLGRQYDVTIVACNSAGKSSAVVQTATTGLQSSMVTPNLPFVLISCLFADTASSRGCQVSFGSVNITTLNRENGSNIIDKSIPVPPDLIGPVVVTVAEILSDETVSLITTQTIVNIPLTTSPAVTSSTESEIISSDFTSANSVTAASTSEISTMEATSATESLLSGSTLYVIIGVIVGIIVFLLILIIFIVICVTRNAYHRKKTMRSLQLSGADELKPNNIYGDQDTLPHLTVATDLGGLENCRQARSNTYDDPQHINGASNGASAPTYETVHSAKKEMLSASGPPVLNPVYGPTGTLSSPASPSPIPTSNGSHKVVANPVYSETGLTHFAVVSPLSPVYAAVGKSAIALEPIQNNQVTANNTPKDVENSPRVPVYEELRTSVKKSPDQSNLTKNESYGLLNSIDTQK